MSARRMTVARKLYNAIDAKTSRGMVRFERSDGYRPMTETSVLAADTGLMNGTLGEMKPAAGAYPTSRWGRVDAIRGHKTWRRGWALITLDLAGTAPCRTLGDKLLLAIPSCAIC